MKKVHITMSDMVKRYSGDGLLVGLDHLGGISNLSDCTDSAVNVLPLIVLLCIR